MKKPRYMVLRLWRGGWLGNDGRETNSLRLAFTFPAEDGYRVQADLRAKRRDYGDVMHGASLELLPKRGIIHEPFNTDRFQRILARLKADRIVAAAESLERQAEGCLSQAKYSQEWAAKLRAQAALLRQTVPTP
jgi:hypothetical protein